MAQILAKMTLADKKCGRAPNIVGQITMYEVLHAALTNEGGNIHEHPTKFGPSFGQRIRNT